MIKKLVLQGFKSFNKKIAIPFREGITIITGPNGSGKCVDGSTLVILADGEVKSIKEIVEYSMENSSSIITLKDGFICKENPFGYKVFSLDPVSLKIKEKKIDAFIKRYERNLLMVKTKSGKKLLSTFHHPFLVLNGNDLVFLEARELRIGDKVAVFKNGKEEFGWDEVIEIKYVKSENKWVYDLSISDYHNFIANDIIVHNSNIIDAICFVLGRSSAKSLRADRLAELIFHGSQTKKQAEVASVSIVFDNSNKIFGTEESELTITRKVNRKGFSIYKINGVTSTKEKVLQVLSSARIYPDGHNIVLQGDVANIIEMNPIERKAIIDEICGIGEYNEKKEKALKDLEVVNQKLREVEIIVSQKNQILESLKKEKEIVEKYKKFQKNLTVLKASYWKKKEEYLVNNLESIEKNLKVLEEKKKSLEEESNKIESEIENNENILKDVGEKIFKAYKNLEKEKEFIKLKNTLDILESKIIIKEREIENINEILSRKELEEEQDIPQAVKSILKLNLKNVYGTIASLIKFPKELEVAIEIAAANHYYDIVVEDFETAKICIEYLKNNKIGRATFLPLDRIKAKVINDEKFKNIEGYIGIASNLLRFDEKFRNAIEFVFGNTIIIKDLDTAEKIGIGDVRMVTIEGDLIERSGALTGGYLIKKFIGRKFDVDELIEKRENTIKELEDLKKEKEKIVKELSKFEKVIEENKDLESLEGLRKNSILLLEKLKENRKKLIEEKIRIQNEINKLNFHKGKVENEIESVRLELQQYKDVEFIDKSLNEIENEIKRVSIEIQNLGSINFKAEEEYEKFKKDFDEIFSKYKKISEEREAVLKMIEEIEKKRKEVFLSTLNAISNNFNELFKKINGGEASLELEEKDNIDSGLLIRASFAGKKLINIDSLSGGEKTITALAFILAIQKYKPSLFYLFDEIDAALDKENTIAIWKIIKELSKNSQFIVISHNEEALRFADYIYGVSMEEGESKIISLELPK
ncbi:MAG: AAA family ATPase [Candidatus Aenigmarchaeota archaeon]|nr:AAA family ATPase [Candidatus Aenigmarchaeota archaeon]MDW8149699.1 AAA family ATPase [Candidatus Aenigmarchaeota archaeon]